MIRDVIHQLALYCRHCNYAYYDLTSIKAALNSTVSRFCAHIRGGVSTSDTIVPDYTCIKEYFFPGKFFLSHFLAASCW